jgi:hypothetical protein
LKNKYEKKDFRALPADVRKGFAFPSDSLSIPAKGCALSRSLPRARQSLEGKGKLRGKAQPFRTAGGRAAYSRFYFSKTIS